MSRKKFDTAKIMGRSLIGGRISYYLELKGWKSSTLAKETGLSEGMISDYISGNHELSLRSFEKLVRKTDIEPYWLLTGEGKPIRPIEDNLPYDDKDQITDYIEKTKYVLSSKDQETATALKMNIIAFHKSVSERIEYDRKDLDKEARIAKLEKELRAIRRKTIDQQDPHEEGHLRDWGM